MIACNKGECGSRKDRERDQRDTELYESFKKLFHMRALPLYFVDLVLAEQAAGLDE